MKSIGVIGAGRLGCDVINSLVRKQYFDHIDLWNRSKATRHGLVESFQLLAYSLGSEAIKIGQIDWGNISKYDVLLISIKDDYDPRALLEDDIEEWIPQDLRFVGVEKDASLLRDLCVKIESFENAILVLTNPLEVITDLVSKWLPHAKVFGGGLSLDAERLRMVAKRHGTCFRRGDLSTAAGEHGRDWFVAELHNDPRKCCASEESVSKFRRKSNAIGYRIVQSLGYSALDCGEVFADDAIWLANVLKADRLPRPFAVRTGSAAIGRPINATSLEPITLCAESEKRLISFCENVEVLSSRLELRFPRSEPS